MILIQIIELVSRLKATQNEKQAMRIENERLTK